VSDFALPISRLTSVGRERCTYCNSAHTQAVMDLTKCLECGATWVTGSGIPLYPATEPPRLLQPGDTLVTKTGKVLTYDEIQALADEADAWAEGRTVTLDAENLAEDDEAQNGVRLPQPDDDAGTIQPDGSIAG
jgi:hypothetical protein